MTAPEFSPEPPVPELHRPLLVDRIGPRGYEMDVTATPDECAALAVRMRLPAIQSLTCHFAMHPLPGGKIAAAGSLRARVVQTCVVTLDDFQAEITDAFKVRFVPGGADGDESEDVSTDPDSEDEIPYAGIVIDLGEAAAEQLALALDPYPRKPDAVLPDAATDPETSPFAALAALRKKN